MRKRETSIRGEFLREFIHDFVNETPLKKPIQTGEFRKNPKELDWNCPKGYTYAIFPYKRFDMEYLRPKKGNTGRVILQLHGGGYIGPMKNIYRTMAVRYSKILHGGDVLTIDYRVAPKHPYPAALEDAVAAYLWLTEEQEYKPEQIMLAGDSAGGGLALALMMYLRDNDYPLPMGAVLMSPWTDLTCSGSSHSFNFKNDPLFGNTTESMLYGSAYIGSSDPRTPYMSPLFGHFHKLPPMLFQVGDYEVLLSDSIDAHRKAVADGCDSRLSVYEGMFHEFQMSLNMIPESKRAWEEAADFIRRRYGLPNPNRSKPLQNRQEMQKVLEEKLGELRTKLEKEKEDKHESHSD